VHATFALDSLMRRASGVNLSVTQKQNFRLRCASCCPGCYFWTPKCCWQHQVPAWNECLSYPLFTLKLLKIWVLFTTSVSYWSLIKAVTDVVLKELTQLFRELTQLFSFKSVGLYGLNLSRDIFHRRLALSPLYYQPTEGSKSNIPYINYCAQHLLWIKKARPPGPHARTRFLIWSMYMYAGSWSTFAWQSPDSLTPDACVTPVARGARNKITFRPLCTLEKSAWGLIYTKARP
jgi:hypothetical protein